MYLQISKSNARVNGIGMCSGDGVATVVSKQEIYYSAKVSQENQGALQGPLGGKMG